MLLDPGNLIGLFFTSSLDGVLFEEYPSVYTDTLTPQRGNMLVMFCFAELTPAKLALEWSQFTLHRKVRLGQVVSFVSGPSLQSAPCLPISGKTRLQIKSRRRYFLGGELVTSSKHQDKIPCSHSSHYADTAGFNFHHSRCIAVVSVAGDEPDHGNDLYLASISPLHGLGHVFFFRTGLDIT